MTDTERILELIKTKNLSNIQFCSITGISPASLSHITSNRSKPTLTILRNVIAGFPDVNPEWIMMGTGPMFRHQNDEPRVNNDEVGKPFAEGQQKDAMPSLFDEEPIAEDNVRFSPTRGRQENAWGTAAPSTNVEDIVKKTLSFVQKPQRKIVEVRIFFDDGTYESFGGKAKG